VLLLSARFVMSSYEEHSAADLVAPHVNALHLAVESKG